MEQNILFHGILPALVSPVTDEGDILVKETEKLVRWQLSQGVNGFYICGSTGEGLLLKKELIQNAKESIHLANT